MNKRFEYTFFQYFKQFERMINLKPLNLGGVAGSGGGAGGPPGGFVGTLPQTRVAYDYSEIASSGVPASGLSLLDNLNHIRYRIEQLEGGSPGQVTIEENDIQIATGVTILNFEGGVDVTNDGGGQVTITVSGVAGSGVLPTLDANRIVITDATGDMVTNAYMNVGPYFYNATYPSIVIGADNGYTDIDKYFLLNIVSDDSEQPLLLNLQSYGYQPSLEFRYTNGTVASPTASLSGDDLGEINFYSNASTNADGSHVGGIIMSATQNHAPTTLGSKLVLQTVPTNQQFAVDAVAIFGDLAEFIGDVEIPSANGYYLGDRTTDNSWRIIPSGVYLTFQKRESGVWNVKNVVPFTTGSGTAITSLDELIDVIISTPSEGQVLTYTGGYWQNADPATSSGTVVGSGGGGGDPFWYIDGELVAISGAGPGFVIPRASTLQAVYVYEKDLGTAGATVIDINKNGTSIFTSNPSLPYNDPNNWVKSTPSVTFVEGDVLTLDIDAVASGASNLTVLAAMVSTGTTVSGSGATSLDELSDVALSSPTEGQFLGYSGGIWQNVAAPTGSSGGSDFSLSGYSPSAWFKTSANVTYDADKLVSQWDDQIASADFVQATAAYKPLYLPYTAQGWPGIAFDGIDNFMVSSIVPATSTGGRTLLLVLAGAVSEVGNTYNHLLHYGTGSTNQAYGITSRSSGIPAYGNHYWANAYSAIAWGELGPAVIIYTYDGTTDRMYFNKSLVGSNAVALNTGNTVGLNIGSRLSGPSECGRMVAFEVATWGSVLSDANRDAIFDGLMSKYRIQ